MTLERVGVVGTGLIGTSIGLALTRRGVAVALVDVDAGHAAAAAALGAGDVADGVALLECDHIIVAVPPSQVPVVVGDLVRLNVRATISDVSSVKSNVLDEIRRLVPHPDRFCGGHPIAGRERGGPGFAQPELFEHAVWAVTPLPATSREAVADVEALARLCGARPVTVSPDLHDRLLAVVSHAPQLAASALAGLLSTADGLAPALAGAGFRDTTRLADSDPDLWADITAANSGALAPVLRRLSAVLSGVADALDEGDRSAVADLIAVGRRQRARLPGKPRAVARPALSRVGVVLADRPGELARLLAAAGAAGVNVEDLAIEHAPDHPVGFVDLEVAADSADVLLEALSSAGWAAHRTS
ncbi:MAG TPA: prephenate dehydrogenase [Mycobacteriales bacterium]|nr:prephenate dehydrogenase [Mycobacteriales bacterium]